MDAGQLRERLRARVRAHVGLDPPAWLLDARVRERALARGLDVDAYLELAGSEGEEGTWERDALADLLRVGETRFFRHRAHVDALRSRVLPERARAAMLAGRPLAAWSAGCASGEEAWTLAMLIAEAPPPGGYEVFASDLSEDALVQARAGVYPRERMNDVPERLRDQWFEDFGDAWRIGAALREHVRFERLNLLASRYPGDFDLILCRNVLIYFDPESRAKVLQRLHGALREGGYLFLGYAETLRDQEERFEAIRDEDGIIYRKRGSWKRVDTPPPAAAPGPFVPRVEKTSQEEPLLLLTGEYHDGARLQAELKPLVSAKRAVVDLDGAVFLGDEAARVLKRAAEATPGLTLRATRPAVRRWLDRHGIKR